MKIFNQTLTIAFIFLISCFIAPVKSVHNIEDFDSDAITLLMSSGISASLTDEEDEDDETSFDASELIEDMSGLIKRRKTFIKKLNKKNLFDDLEDAKKAFDKNQLKEYLQSLDDDKKTRLKSAIVTCGSTAISWMFMNACFPDIMDYMKPSSELMQLMISAGGCYALKNIHENVDLMQSETQKLQNLMKFIIFKIVKSIIKGPELNSQLAITDSAQSNKRILKKLIRKYFKVNRLIENIHQAARQEIPLYMAILKSLNAKNITSLLIDKPGEEKNDILDILKHPERTMNRLKSPITSIAMMVLPHRIQGATIGAGAAITMWFIGNIFAKDIMQFIETNNYAALALTVSIMCSMYLSCQKLSPLKEGSDSIQKTLSPVLWLIAELAVYCNETNTIQEPA